MNQKYPMSDRTITVIALGAISLILAGCGGDDDDDLRRLDTDQLYTQTNETTNAVVHMTRNKDGSITIRNRTATGGAGLNGIKPGTTAPAPDSLVSQGSVIISPDKTTLFAVNAGDSSVSVFSVDQKTGDLTLKKSNKLNGSTPNSLAFHGGFLYVLFQTGTNQLGAYALQSDGSLTQLSLQRLPVSNTPTQVSLSPDKNFVLVNAGTATNRTLAYPRSNEGMLGTPVINDTPSPFASTFAPGNVQLATNTNGKALASYNFTNTGMLNLIGSVVSGEAAPCWVEITPNGKYAYVGNGAGTISSYAVAGTGTLTLLNAKAASEPGIIAGVGNVGGDMWASPDNKFLYATHLGADKVVAYRIGDDGSLTKINEQIIGTATRLSVQGLAGL